MLSLIALSAGMIAMLLAGSMTRAGRVKGYARTLLNSRIAALRVAITDATKEMSKLDRRKRQVTTELISLNEELCDLVDALRCRKDADCVIWDGFPCRSTEDRDWDNPDENEIQKVPTKTVFIWDGYPAESSADNEWESTT